MLQLNANKLTACVCKLQATSKCVSPAEDDPHVVAEGGLFITSQFPALVIEG